MITTFDFYFNAEKVLTKQQFDDMFACLASNPVTKTALYGTCIADERRRIRFLYVIVDARDTENMKPLAILVTSYNTDSEKVKTFLREWGFGCYSDIANTNLENMPFALPYVTKVEEGSCSSKFNYAIYTNDSKETLLITFRSGINL
jgi:hypothetical protein